jgi:thiol-disulfide isomerase/thioredoxin
MAEPRRDGLAWLAHGTYITVAGLLVFAFAWTLMPAVQQQNDSPCRALAPETRTLDMPAATLRDLAGNEVELSAFAGKFLVVNFWATWCEPCKEEMPAMERLYRAHRDAGFELVAISVGEEPEPVRAFRDQLGLSFPVLLDPDRVAAKAYQTNRFPESFLVDAGGVVVERYIGPKTWDHAAYQERVGRLIAGEDAP